MQAKLKISKKEKEALHLSKTWYKTLDEKLIYKNINLGGMVDFLVFNYYTHPAVRTQIINQINRIGKYSIENVIKKFLREYIPIASRIKHKPRKTDKSHKKIFLYIREAKKFLPLIKQLGERGYDLTIVAEGYTPRMTLTKENIYYKKFVDYKNSKVKQIVKRYEKYFKDLRSECDLEDGIFDLLFSVVFRRLVETIEIGKNIIEKEHPQLFITLTDVTPIKKTLVTLFNQHKIPSLVLLHGLPANPSHYSHDGQTATKMAVWGKGTKDFFVSMGVEKEKLVITGSSGFDFLMKYKSLKTKKGMVLYASTPLPDAEETFITILKAMESFPGKKLILKVHTAENADFYKRIAEKMNKQVPVVKRADIYELLASCELLLTRSSTVGLEGLIFGKPVITFDRGEHTMYQKTGATQNIHNLQDYHDLVEKMRIALDKKTTKKLAKDRQKFIYDMVYKQDGKSTERIISLIEKMMKDSSTVV